MTLPLVGSFESDVSGGFESSFDFRMQNGGRIESIYSKVLCKMVDKTMSLECRMVFQISRIGSVGYELTCFSVNTLIIRESAGRAGFREVSIHR